MRGKEKEEEEKEGYIAAAEAALLSTADRERAENIWGTVCAKWDETENVHGSREKI